MKMISMQVFVDDEDAEDIEESLHDWYNSHDYDMYHIFLQSKDIASKRFEAVLRFDT